MSQQITEIKEVVFVEANQYFAALMQDIEQAASHIDFETYIFDLDSVGIGVAEHLAGAGRRGVVVRILLDGVGSSTAGGILAQQLSCAGVQVRIYNPLPWNIHHWEWSSPPCPGWRNFNTWRWLLFHYVFKIALIQGQLVNWPWINAILKT